MADLRQQMIDALSQHASHLYRASTQTVADLSRQFDASVREMLYSLSALLDELSEHERIALSGGRYTTPRLREIKRLIDDWVAGLDDAIQEKADEDYLSLIGNESAWAVALLAYAGLSKGQAKADKSVLSKAKLAPLSGGQLMGEMLKAIPTKAQAQILHAIRQGIAEGKGNGEIIKAIRGTKSLNYLDSVLVSPKRDLETAVRTIRSHVANTAHVEAYKASGVLKVRFVAVLDNKTSKQCASLDGNEYDIDDLYPIPPLHPNCRSMIMPVIKGVTMGTELQPFAQWFDDQSESFKRGWLGPTRYRLYKEGHYTINRFVDPQGKTYTIDELRLRDKQTFDDIFNKAA